jgi:hypothetical protein
MTNNELEGTQKDAVVWYLVAWQWEHKGKNLGKDSDYVPVVRQTTEWMSDYQGQHLNWEPPKYKVKMHPPPTQPQPTWHSVSFSVIW